MNGRAREVVALLLSKQVPIDRVLEYREVSARLMGVKGLFGEEV